VIGATLLPIALARFRVWVLGVLLAALFLTLLDPTSWPTGFGWKVFQDRVSGGDAAAAAIVLVIAVAAIALGYAVSSRARPGPARSTAAVAVAAVVVFGGLAGVHRHYLDSRYDDTSYPYGRMVAWAHDVHDARIAVVGAFMQSQYPMYGVDLSNHVQYAGVHTAHGGWRRPRTCREWIRFLEHGRYDYVAIAPSEHFREWTQAQPDAHVAVTAPIDSQGIAVLQVYRLDKPAAKRHC
jgi:hypothetical protein